MTIRALIVEDDPSWQRILEELLADMGFTVDIASTLDDAVETVRALPHRLAVVDLSLQGNDHRRRDGFEVLQTIQSHDPGCVAILLTGHATVEIAVSALTDYGAFTC